MTGSVQRVEIKPPKPDSAYVSWEKFGQKTDGILLKKETVAGKYGQKVDCHFSPPDGKGEFIVSMSPAVLRAVEPDLEVGMRYEITYVSNKWTKGGSMKVFTVFRLDEVGKPDVDEVREPDLPPF